MADIGYLSNKQIIARFRRKVRQLKRQTSSGDWAYGWWLIQCSWRDIGLELSVHVHGFVRFDIQIGPFRVALGFRKTGHRP